MTPDEYRGTLINCWFLARTIAAMPLEEMVAAINHSHSVGPILDPTLYRANLGKVQEDATVVGALLGAQQEILTAFPSLADTSEQGGEVV